VVRGVAEVTRVVEGGEWELEDGVTQTYQVFETTIRSPRGDRGRVYTLDSRADFVRLDFLPVVVGEKFVYERERDNPATIGLIEVWRVPRMVWLFALFLMVVLLVGRWRGLLALGGLAMTFGILIFGLLPALLAGWPPLFMTLLASAVILGVAMVISHGWNAKTKHAMLAAYGGLGAVAVLSWLTTRVVNLSGLTSEEALMLSSDPGTSSLSFQGLLLSAVVLGAVGVLDDVAITQVQTVDELRRADTRLSGRDLYRRAMEVGRHHIASVINTLILAYTGAAFPLVLLFVVSGQSFVHLLNTEFMAEEIVRTLVGTIGLVLTVPLATYLASRRL
jgi:uncharacterized membrane protein